MKQLMLFTACLLFIWYVGIISCEKDKDSSASRNKAPVANAGPDFAITLDYCSYRNGTATLDGSGSSDPDNKIVTYSWVKVSGPEGITIQNRSVEKAVIENVSAGTYVFELFVRDEHGLYSRDSVVLSAGSTDPGPEYNLDITANATYVFYDNLADCYYDCTYNDLTVVVGKATFLPFGEFHVYINEYADTATSSNVHATDIYVGTASGDGEFLSGPSAVNFKKVIQSGGGSFSGVLTPMHGSAEICGDVFKNLPSLLLSGNLDTATHTATITIKGRVLF